MKTNIKFLMCAMAMIITSASASFSQEIDEQRMARDLAVAENVLSTLIKQELNNQRMFYGLNIRGTYQQGYGVTFRLPSSDMNAFIYAPAAPQVHVIDPLAPVTVIQGGRDRETVVARSYEEKQAFKLLEKAQQQRNESLDSAREGYDNLMIKVAKDFIVDYGDFITQLGPNEKIVLTNEADRNQRARWYRDSKRKFISVEATKSDLTAFKQGKINRSQMVDKVTVINKEYVDTKETDLELFASIFTRLYSSDLSKTFFTSNNIYYERLKDYGAVFYMQVYSSSEADFKQFIMPTQGAEAVDEETRNKKVVELYPKFEQEMKENIVEYGRTIKNLKDDESLVFNVTLTKCKDCGIPSVLELSVKASVLRDYSAGKIDRKAAISKVILKKGPKQ